MHGLTVHEDSAKFEFYFPEQMKLRVIDSS